MKFSFSTKTDLLPEIIWPFYADVTKWYSWEKELKEISLAGEFEKGVSGIMTLSDQLPMDFTLASVIPNCSFTNKTTIPNVGDLFFHHELTHLNEETTIRHEVEFIPLNRNATIQDTFFVSTIFSDVPAAIFALIEAAK